MSRAAISMYLAAGVLLLGLFMWGAMLYPGLPDSVPTHWGVSGQADAFSAKTLWSAFGSLFIGLIMAVGMLVVHLVMLRSPQLVPAERDAYGLMFGYLSLSLAALFAWISAAAWYGLDLGALFIVFALLSGLPVLVIMGFYMPVISQQRKQQLGPREPSQDPKYWVLGGLFYANPKDPRVFVPKPPPAGIGMTMNLATSAGRWMAVGVLLLLVATVVLVVLL